MEELIKELEKIDSLSIKNGVSKHHIEITKNKSEVILSANKQGLVWLALEALKLAQKQQDDFHVHIDGCSLADKAEIDIVITYKSAEW